jgi:hypothetical protein
MDAARFARAIFGSTLGLVVLIYTPPLVAWAVSGWRMVVDLLAGAA